MADITEELKQAVDLAAAGNWDGAHGIVQRFATDANACWLHALIHKVEGDDANARYWYRRTGHGYDDFADPVAELAAIREALMA